MKSILSILLVGFGFLSTARADVQCKTSVGRRIFTQTRAEEKEARTETLKECILATGWNGQCKTNISCAAAPEGRPGYCYVPQQEHWMTADEFFQFARTVSHNEKKCVIATVQTSGETRTFGGNGSDCGRGPEERLTCFKIF